jgi:hypothetical protein
MHTHNSITKEGRQEEVRREASIFVRPTYAYLPYHPSRALYLVQAKNSQQQQQRLIAFKC